MIENGDLPLIQLGEVKGYRVTYYDVLKLIKKRTRTGTKTTKNGE
jgi:hypothetical protein